MKKQLALPSQNIEVPCKNNLLHVQKSREQEVFDNLLTRAEKIGKFYYLENSDGPLFKDCLFEEDMNYDGNFQLEAPLKLFWEITGRCNLKCKGCYVPGYKGKDHDLEKLKFMVDNASASGVMGLQLLGGEPTLLNSLPELTKYIKSKNMRVEIVSNGYVIDKNLIKSLENSVDYCAISIDGNEKNHNLYRGKKDSFQKAIEAFNLLRKSKIGTEILMTINKKNIDQIDEVFEICERDPSLLYLKILHPSDIMINSNNDLYLSENEKQYIREKAELLGVGCQIPSAYFKEPGSYSFFGCPGGVLTGVIDYKGDVFKCLYSRKESMGNAYTDSIRDIWRKNNEALAKEMGVKCKKCTHKSRCGGFCDLGNDRKRFYF